MGCSATKTVPQEHSTPDKGHNNGNILKQHKDADVKCHTSGKENNKHNPDMYNSQNGGQTGGQTGGEMDVQTTGETGDHTSQHTTNEVDSKISTEIKLSKDLGLRKLQRKETPQAGPLALNNKDISHSQMEFFKLLDEKIEKGGEIEEGEIEEGDDIT